MSSTRTGAWRLSTEAWPAVVAAPSIPAAADRSTLTAHRPRARGRSLPCPVEDSSTAAARSDSRKGRGCCCTKEVGHSLLRPPEVRSNVSADAAAASAGTPVAGPGQDVAPCCFPVGL
ncbi:unnamed protein product [Urochloa humidicola]